MDEILIEGSKYVSSKQATKLTGYAKDYIGQLCREGRVPARLVGRSWYVLETAITNHRFGKDKDGAQGEDASPVTPAAPAASPAWESPRYETTPVEPLPPPALFTEIEDASLTHDTTGDEGDISKRLEDSWKEWFSRIGNPQTDTPEEKETHDDKDHTEDATPITVRAIHHSLSAELLPRIVHTDSFAEKERVAEVPEHTGIRRTPHGRKRVVFQLAGALCALLIMISAILGTGEFDDLLISNDYFSAIAGISVYNR